jgi:DNA replication protein DnaC
MKNREIYLKDPSVQKLVNEGIAYVNDDTTSEAMAVLRYELETFVCDGQYEKGMEHILETYLKNIDQANQPAVWISGFYGSGKSHLVKMLRAL